MYPPHLSIAAKHHHILPKQHAVSRHIVIDEHESSDHLSYNYVLSRLRLRFWLISGVSAVVTIWWTVWDVVFGMLSLVTRSSPFIWRTSTTIFFINNMLSLATS